MKRLLPWLLGLALIQASMIFSAFRVSRVGQKALAA